MSYHEEVRKQFIWSKSALITFHYQFIWIIFCMFCTDFNTYLVISRLPWITNYWSPISQQGTDYLSHKISESAVRDKWPLDSMSEINSHGEIHIMPPTMIEPAIPWLQIRCSNYWSYPGGHNHYFKLHRNKMFCLWYKQWKYRKNRFTLSFKVHVHVPQKFYSLIRKTF